MRDSGAEPGTGALDAAEVQGQLGGPWCRDWTERIDAAVAGLLDAARARGQADGGLSVVALGSYARRELCPSSDVDLLLLHDGWATRDLEALVQSLCYPLWDAGLTVGHAVRTPGEAVRAAADRIDTATALTDRRLVAGVRGPLDELAGRTSGWLARNRSALLGDIATADGERHAGAGRRPGMLEPHLKDGAGGLRDLHSLRWAAACLLGEAGLDPLVTAGYIGAAERRELAAAGERLLAVRCALHLVQREGSGGVRRPGKELDRLRLDLQDDVAARLGLPSDTGADDLLRAVGLASRTVAYLHDRSWRLLASDGRRGRRLLRRSATDAAGAATGEGFRLVDGLLEVIDDRRLTDEPSLGLRALVAAASRGARLGRRTAERWRRELAPGDLPSLPKLPSLRWDEACRAALLELLRAGPAGAAVLADADHVGLLTAHLPDWQHVRGRPQRNPVHRFDLDTHALQAVAELHGITQGELDPGHRQLWAALGAADQEELLLAALLHDVGKAWPGDHSKVGATLARDWMLHMGFRQRRADTVARLVRLHLLLPEAATRCDLDDAEELRQVARQAGGTVVLDQLLLLSLADSRATGPAAHSPWKDSLMATLHRRVRRLLDDGGKPEERSDQLTLGRAVELAPQAGVSEDHVRRLVEGTPRRYLLVADAEQVLAHARLLDPLPRVGTLRSDVRPGPAAGTWTLTVLGADRPGLMADCAGVLAGHGLTVLAARAFTRPAGADPGASAPDAPSGVALDWFVVRPADQQAEVSVASLASVASVDWSGVERDLQAGASGHLQVGELVRLREARRDVRVPAAAAGVPVEVAFSFRGVSNRIEVRCPDAPGALYRLARTLAEEGLDVLGARVATLGAEVNDVFFVRPSGGPPDTDRLRQRLRAAARLPEHLQLS